MSTENRTDTKTCSSCTVFPVKSLTYFFYGKTAQRLLLQPKDTYCIPLYKNVCAEQPLLHGFCLKRREVISPKT
uniref:Uncharacterized protein n=1 Tax=Pyxicephalus adspersus TaxID=30357 RepID=A0AAV3A194_PYXAD|nr:TPA: hypothetical protein GDO54_016487 [Pyxicephalus adspersus]